MKVNTSIHHANNVKLEAIYVENGMSLTMKIVATGGDYDITLYGLSNDDVDRFVSAFGEPRYCGYVNKQSVYPEEMARLKKKNAELERLLEASGVAP